MEEYVVRKVGCQPPWRKFDFTGIPVCDSWQLLDMYGQKSAIMAETEGGKVTKETKCLLPCSFMEYKVNIKLPFNLFVSISIDICFYYIV